jgi:hypothetical protein
LRYGARGPLQCCLAAHSGGNGPRPRGAPRRNARDSAGRVLGSGDFTDAGGPATRSEWRRFQRSTGGAVNSPGRGVEARRLDGRRCGARWFGSPETCTETERVRRPTTGARGDGREVSTAAKAERKWWCGALTRAEAVKRDRAAMVVWCFQTRAVRRGKAAAASDTGCRGGARGEARAASDSGGTPRTRDVASKYLRGAGRGDNATGRRAPHVSVFSNFK